MKMKKNVGQIDQIIRYALAVIFVVLAFRISLWFLLGAAVMLFTALFSFCGLYKIFGINTCKIEKK